MLPTVDSSEIHLLFMKHFEKLGSSPYQLVLAGFLPSTVLRSLTTPRYDLLLIHNDTRIGSVPGSFEGSKTWDRWAWNTFSVKKCKGCFCKHPNQAQVLDYINDFAMLYRWEKRKTNKSNISKMNIHSHIWYPVSMPPTKMSEKRTYSNNSLAWFKLLHSSFNQKYHTKQFPSFLS